MRQHELRLAETDMRKASSALEAARPDCPSGRLANRRAIIRLQVDGLADEVRSLIMELEREPDDAERNMAEIAALDAGIEPTAE